MHGSGTHLIRGAFVSSVAVFSNTAQGWGVLENAATRLGLEALLPYLSKAVKYSKLAVSPILSVSLI